MKSKIPEELYASKAACKGWWLDGVNRIAEGPPVIGEGAEGRLSSICGDAELSGEGKLCLRSLLTGRMIAGNSVPSRGGNLSFLGTGRGGESALS